MRFENGFIPDERLVRVENQAVFKPTSIAYRRFLHAVKGKAHLATPEGGYRDRKLNEDFIAHPERHGVLASVNFLPANLASHGTGHCLDIIPDGMSLLELRTAALRFGFTATIPQTDQFHLEHDAHTCVLSRAHAAAIVTKRFELAGKPLLQTSRLHWTRRISRDSRFVALLETKLGLNTAPLT